MYGVTADIVFRLHKMQRRVYSVIREHGPLTDLDINELCAKEYGRKAESTYRKRRCELVDAGLVVKAGETVQNDCVRVLWTATEPGGYKHSVPAESA